MDQTPTFQCSIESRQLADFLLKHAATEDYDTILTYEQLSHAAGVDVRVKASVLQTARNIVLREANRWFCTMRKSGIKLSTPAEASGEGERGRQLISRTSTRYLKRMATVDFAALDDSQKIRHNMNASLLGAIRLMNGKSAQKKLEGAVINSEARLPVRETLKLFGVESGDTNASRPDQTG